MIERHPFFWLGPLQRPHIVSAIETGSFDVSLEGLAEAIDALDRALTPSERKARRRLVQDMANRSEFETVIARNAATVDTVRSVIEVADMLRAAGLTDESESREFIRSTIEAQQASTERLIYESIAPPEPEE